MPYDKIKADGSVIKAPEFTYRVLFSVPVLFELAEWVLIIVAFQYVDVRFGFLAAKVAWLALTFALALYVGVRVANVLWQVVEDPYKNRKWRIFSQYVLPFISAALVFGIQQLVKQMVLAQHG